MVKHDVRWLAPAPLWNSSVSETLLPDNDFIKPAILRFDSDTFMEEFMALLDSSPEQLQAWVAKYETWRQPMSTDIANDAEQEAPLLSLLKRSRGLPTVSTLTTHKKLRHSADNAQQILKLYQPAQQRYYLVSATLACKTAGLPDKQVDNAKQETVSFVLRRLAEDEQEYAFIARGKSFAWQRIDAEDSAKLQTGEECLPLFNINYQHKPEQKRRVFAGLIPVGRREAYLAASLDTPVQQNPDTTLDFEYSPLRLLFEAQVIAPWNALRQQAEIQKILLDETESSSTGDVLERHQVRADILKPARENQQTIAWYILLDFADYLETYLPAVWQKILTGNGSLNVAETALLDHIASIKVPVPDKALNEEFNGSEYESMSGVSVLADLSAALASIQAYREALEAVATPYVRKLMFSSADGWPDKLFVFADPEVELIASIEIQQLIQLLEAVLPQDSENAPDSAALKLQQGSFDNNARFVIRCVYQQPQCEPVHTALLSVPSEAFSMAAFFDPDAPSRPIRIPMPMDISPAGLRKYQKNTSLVVSDMLCGKIARIRKMTLADLVLSILPWPLHKDLPDLEDSAPCKADDDSAIGIMCSLSIPIVTLVALVLMIIMVSLFDIVFKWIPYLFMCLPIPGLKGKNNT